ncbi:MAG: hypothetical protein WA728_36280 [Xanthobacteraceae bacterium]
MTEKSGLSPGEVLLALAEFVGLGSDIALGLYRFAPRPGKRYGSHRCYTQSGSDR